MYAKCQDKTTAIPAPVWRALKKEAVNQNCSLKDLMTQYLEQGLAAAGVEIKFKEEELPL